MPCLGCLSWALCSGSENRMCTRWKDMHVSKKDHEKCYWTGKKRCISSWERCLSKDALTWMNIEPSLHVCSIAHCTWRTFEMKYTAKPRVSFHWTKGKLKIASMRTAVIKIIPLKYLGPSFLSLKYLPVLSYFPCNCIQRASVKKCKIFFLCKLFFVSWKTRIFKRSSFTLWQNKLIPSHPNFLRSCQYSTM